MMRKTISLLKDFIYYWSVTRFCIMGSRDGSWRLRSSSVQHIISVWSTWWTIKSTRGPGAPSRSSTGSRWRDDHGEWHSYLSYLSAFTMRHLHSDVKVRQMGSRVLLQVQQGFPTNWFHKTWPSPVLSTCFSVSPACLSPVCPQWWWPAVWGDGAWLSDCSRSSSVSQRASVRGVWPLSSSCM